MQSRSGEVTPTGHVSLRLCRFMRFGLPGDIQPAISAVNLWLLRPFGSLIPNNVFYQQQHILRGVVSIYRTLPWQRRYWRVGNRNAGLLLVDL